MDNIVYQICAVVITLSFLALVVYVIITLKALQVFLDKMDVHVDAMHKNLDELSKGSARFINNTNEMTEEIWDKVHSFQASSPMSFVSNLISHFIGSKKSRAEPESTGDPVSEFASSFSGSSTANLTEEESKLHNAKHYIMLAEKFIEYFTFGIVIFKRVKKIRDELRK